MSDHRSAERRNRSAAFFDRDGVINVDHGYVGSVDRFELLEGAADALRLCRDEGLLVFVVTNQSGVARGLFDEAAVDAVHAHMRRLLAHEGAEIDDIRVCPHHIDGVIERYRRDCACRKPMPGMILDLMQDWQINPTSSFLIGDKDSDIAAAAAAGIMGKKFTGGSLLSFVQATLAVSHRGSHQRA